MKQLLLLYIKISPITLNYSGNNSMLSRGLRRKAKFCRNNFLKLQNNTFDTAYEMGWKQLKTCVKVKLNYQWGQIQLLVKMDEAYHFPVFTKYTSN